MRCSWFTVALVSPMLLLLAAGTSFAGVVVGETSTAQASNGVAFSANKTVYVQGNKQKIDEERISTIMDLDESVIYVIDKTDRVYTEIPLKPLSPGEPGNIQGETVDLNRTGETRIIANHACDEYRTIEENKRERVIISACVSTSAPGAKEVAEFDRNMATHLDGRESKSPADGGVASLTLEKQSVLSFRVPDASRNKVYRTTSLMARTRVNKIQLKPLPPETFKPPKGYSKLMNRPPKAFPSNPVEPPDQIVDTVAQNLRVS